MKKILLTISFIITVFGLTVNAQDDKSKALNAPITYYIEIKNALIEGYIDSVRIASTLLYNSLGEVQESNFTSSQLKRWNQYKEKLSYDAEHMKQSDDLKHQREHFSRLSVNFFKLLKGLNMIPMDLYYQFCPMAMDGKGAYWFSEKENILNPYFGKRMLTCGSTKETLKAKQD